MSRLVHRHSSRSGEGERCRLRPGTQPQLHAKTERGYSDNHVPPRIYPLLECELLNVINPIIAQTYLDTCATYVLWPRVSPEINPTDQ
jgi:hypothetical protein